jgi:hypothetical protein
VRRVVAAIDDELAASVELRTTADWMRPVA